MLKVRCPICKGNRKHFKWVEGKGYEVCENCNHGYVNADENLKVYVNVYTVTREFGGYEEGGWYYDNLTCIDTVPCKNKHSDEIQEDLKIEYHNLKHGNISSVLGGVDVVVYIEDKMKKSETKERPQYE